MKGYSNDLRERVVAALDQGMSRQEVTTTFRVSLGSIKRWLRLRRDTGQVAPRRVGRRPRAAVPHEQAALREQLQAAPDATLPEHAALWNALFGTTLSHWTLGRRIRQLGWTRKKKRS